MKGESSRRDQPSFMIQGLKEMCNPRDPMHQLADMIPWDQVELWFEDKYAVDGRPAKPVRLMVSLLLLKQFYNLGDETVVEEWVHNPYMRKPALLSALHERDIAPRIRSVSLRESCSICRRRRFSLLWLRTHSSHSLACCSESRMERVLPAIL